MTGSWWPPAGSTWARHHLLRKKLQVAAFGVRGVDDVDSVFKVPSRISSTWAARWSTWCARRRILETIVSEKLLSNATLRGVELQTACKRWQSASLPWCATCAAAADVRDRSADARGAHGADQAGVRRALLLLPSARRPCASGRS